MNNENIDSMNRLEFYVNRRGDVIKCKYHADCDRVIDEEIILPGQELFSVFSDFVNNWPNLVHRERGFIDIYICCDVDIDIVKKLIQRSHKYQESHDYSKVTQFRGNFYAPQSAQYQVSRDKSSKSGNVKKVNRTNKFKKTVIKTATIILATLVVFSLSKHAIEEFGSKGIDFPTTFSDDLPFKIKAPVESIGFGRKGNETIDNGELEPKDSDDFSTKEPEMLDNLDVVEEPIIDNYLRIPAENLVDGEKYCVAKDYYGGSLSKIANKYGIDPALALAVCTHERGMHSNAVDEGGGLGLFQIQIEGDGFNWNNKTVTAFNFETNQYEKVLITKDSVSDVFINMQVGCMMLQNLLVQYNYNVAEAVTAYNYGGGNLLKVLNKCSEETGFSIEELNNINNMEWLEYRDIIKGGDPRYLENVFKYVPDETILTFRTPTQEEIIIKFDNLNYPNITPVIS